MGFLKRLVSPLVSAGDEAKARISLLPTWSGEQMARWNYQQLALEGYHQNIVVAVCVDKVSTNAAEPEIGVYGAKNGVRESMPEHPLSALMRHPNPIFSRYEFFEMLLTTFQIAGNAFLYKERSRSGDVVALWILRPDRMRIIPDPNKYVSKYVYTVNGTNQDIKPEDLIHWRRFDPLNDYWGMPKLGTIAQEVDSFNAMNRFMRSFFNNAGVPYGVIKMKGSTTETQANRVRDRWKRMFSGPNGWHDVAVLDDDATYEKIGVNMGTRELAMVELRDVTEADICATFGVPPQLVGLNVGIKNMIYNTYREARAAFWGETIVPMLERLCSKLQEQLLVDFESPESVGIKYFVRVDLDHISALQPDQEAMANARRQDMVNGGLTPDEYRAFLGLEPLPDGAGQVLYIPSTVVPTLTTNAAKPQPKPIATPGPAAQGASNGK